MFGLFGSANNDEFGKKMSRVKFFEEGRPKSEDLRLDHARLFWDLCFFGANPSSRHQALAPRVFVEAIHASIGTSALNSKP